jgi:hypothetical protein
VVWTGESDIGFKSCGLVVGVLDMDMGVVGGGNSDGQVVVDTWTWWWWTWE